jgi:hypothetical protein
MDQVSLVVHTLNAYPYVQLENVCEQLLSVAGQEMHGSDAGQRAHHSSDGHVVVDSLDDHLREPHLVPSPEDERTDELVFDCRCHLVFSARLSQCAWEENAGDRVFYILHTGGGIGQIEVIVCGSLWCIG